MKRETPGTQASRSGGTPRPGPSHRLATPAPGDSARPLLEALPVGVVQASPGGAVVWANVEACRILGRPLSELVGTSFADLQMTMIDGSGRPQGSNDGVAARGESPRQPQSIAGLPRADGTTMWIALAAATIVDPATSQAAGTIFSVIDVSLLHESMDAMRRSERSFQAMAENAITGIWQITAKGTTVYLNPAMCRLLEVDGPGEAVGKSFRAFFSAEMLTRIDREHAKRPLGVASSYEVELTGAKGTKRFVIISGAPVMGPDGRLQTLIATVTDITEQKLAVQALRRSSDLQRLMLSELDHRVRNNLASLAALIDITARESCDVKEFAASIKGRVQAMSTAHSLLSRGHWAPMPLAELIESLIPADLRDRVIVRGPGVLVTPRQIAALAMVFQELLANSLKHGALGSSGEVEAQWSADPASEGEGTLVRFCWRESLGDSGARAPAARAPSKGEGTSLMCGLVRSELRGSLTLTYPASGAAHELVFTIDPADALAGAVRIDGTDSLSGDDLGKKRH